MRWAGGRPTLPLLVPVGDAFHPLVASCKQRRRRHRRPCERPAVLGEGGGGESRRPGGGGGHQDGLSTAAGVDNFGAAVRDALVGIMVRLVPRCVGAFTRPKRDQSQRHSRNPLSRERCTSNGSSPHCFHLALPNSAGLVADIVRNATYTRESHVFSHGALFVPKFSLFVEIAGHLPVDACPTASDPRHAPGGAPSAPRPLPNLGRGKGTISPMILGQLGGGDCEARHYPRGSVYDVQETRSC